MNLSYQIIKLVLRLRGVKKIFSEDPINYLKLRKGDVYEASGRFFKNHGMNTFPISRTKITAFKSDSDSGRLLIFVHGGAYVSGPTQLHWNAIKEILKHTVHTTWLCDYPKAPEHKIPFICDQMDKVYKEAQQKHPSKEIVLIGDSVGGSLITSLTQRLVLTEQPLPTQLILISPVMDATMTNPEIEAVDVIDPMLSKLGLLSAKKMCAANEDVSDVLISPINGSFVNFPQTHLLMATDDITYPDQKIFAEKLKEAGVDHHIIEAENMPHIWPILPVMQESKKALMNIIKKIA